MTAQIAALAVSVLAMAVSVVAWRRARRLAVQALANNDQALEMLAELRYLTGPYVPQLDAAERRVLLRALGSHGDPHAQVVADDELATAWELRERLIGLWTMPGIGGGGEGS